MTPDEYTLKQQFIDVGDGHQLYIQEWGSAKGLPIVFLHGGPGSQCKDKHKGVFDPRLHRVIFFDQRGCGQSLPYGSLEHNTTQDLIEDINKITERLGLRSFVLTGGSWGSTLALAYGVANPKRVKAMVLHGILAGSQAEIDWFEKGRFENFYPEAWERYLASVPSSQRHNPGAYHFKRVLGGNETEAQQSGHAYETLEASVYSLDDRFQPDNAEGYDPSGIRLEIHYLANRFFMPDNHIFEQAYKLTMPIWLVQGRYDMICPPVTAYQLSQKLSKGHLVMTVSNHRAEHEDTSVMRAILTQLAETR